MSKFILDNLHVDCVEVVVQKGIVPGIANLDTNRWGIRILLVTIVGGLELDPVVDERVVVRIVIHIKTSSHEPLSRV